MAALAFLVAWAVFGLANCVLPDNWKSLTKEAKMDVIWKQIKDLEYKTNPLPRSEVSEEVLKEWQFLAQGFDQSIEELNATREKAVGTNGIAAKIEMIILPNSSYTGIFAPGQRSMGIGRLSSNTAPNLVSFFAAKFFVDYNTSQHLHLIHDIDGWGRPEPIDFLQWSKQSGTPEPLPADYAAGRFSKEQGQAFQDAIDSLPGGPLHRPPNIWALDNVEMSHVDVTNKIYEPIVAPWMIQITPNQALRPLQIKIYEQDWRSVVISKLYNNTVLYNLEAQASPCDPWLKIGEIWTRSEWSPSWYHDRWMRFGQPYQQWDYSVAPKGVYCSKDPRALTVWSDEEANEILFQAGNSTSNAYGNSKNATAGVLPSGGVDPGIKLKPHA